ncbi:MAG: ADP-ribose pyrophosphatase [Labilithrix sp.]|nr:ADP-ribose pyrophosphatase [Labilithrix sp.]
MTAPRATLPDLPALPVVELETVRETRLGDGGFLVLRRLELVAIANGERSKPFPYDAIDRRAFDASVMVAHHVEDDRVWVWLRSSLRPPLALRPDARTPAVMWELPAGLVEPGESPRAAAARELLEELGFAVDESAMRDLGPSSYPAPAMIGELHHFFHVEVDPKTRTEPEGDGSPVEAGAIVVSVPLDTALDACRSGAIRDEKTELALRRLADVIGAKR